MFSIEADASTPETQPRHTSVASSLPKPRRGSGSVPFLSVGKRMNEEAVPKPSPAAGSTARLRIRFALGFVVIAGVLFGIYTFPYQESGISERWFTTYLSAYASVAGSALSLVEPGLQVHGQDIIGRTSLRIVKNCDAMEAEILFLAAVLAFPSAWRKRLIGAALGALTIAVVNVIRIACLYQIGVHFPTAFEFVHLELWPLLLVVSAVAVFLVWATWARRGPGRDTHAPA
jgi:exosortase H (IPTLxxWG-CTERM-specific)